MKESVLDLAEVYIQLLRTFRDTDLDEESDEDDDEDLELTPEEILEEEEMDKLYTIYTNMYESAEDPHGNKLKDKMTFNEYIDLVISSTETELNLRRQN